MDKFSLAGKVAIVTGSDGLLGRQHVAALAEAGASVVAADLTDEGACLAGLEGDHFAVAVDITKPDSVVAMTTATMDRFGKIDILVNNAAVNDMFERPELAGELSRFESYPLEQWQRSMDVNVTGMFLVTQSAGAEMAKAKSGSIINIASTYGLTGPDQRIYKDKDGAQVMYKSPAYPTTKGAVIAFTRFVAAYWGEVGVRANTLSPGGVENGQTETFIANYSSRTPLGRMASPDDYRGAIVFLASDASAYMTGANLSVDGGWTTW